MHDNRIRNAKCLCLLNYSPNSILMFDAIEESERIRENAYKNAKEFLDKLF